VVTLQHQRHRIGDAEYLVGLAGSGPPLLMLHGFPQTHHCWRRVAPSLEAGHTLVLPDLRGYGGSVAPPGGPRGEGYSKREMAAELVELMAALGHRRFAVVGHDRGARVGYRMALDRPQAVERLAVLNVIPTCEQFDRMSRPSLGYWPWYLLAQPSPFPERLIGGDREQVLRFVFDSWTAEGWSIGEDAFARYLVALDPDTIAAMCADYRASFWIDRRHDQDDRRAGRRIACPLLVVTGADESQLADAGHVWREWAKDVQAVTVPGGHFVPEEAPEELAAALRGFLD
jgi:haloacetate dehalogenase